MVKLSDLLYGTEPARGILAWPGNSGSNRELVKMRTVSKGVTVTLSWKDPGTDNG